MTAYKDVFEQIEVPSAQVDMMIQQAINKGKRHQRRKKYASIGASAALLLICILSTGLVSTSMARVLVHIPFVGSVFASYAQPELANLNREDITQLDKMQITENGVTVEIKEIYYDQSNISIAYLVSGADYSDAKHFNVLFSYQGNPIGGGGGADYNQIADKLYSGLEMFYPAVGHNLPDRFNLEVVLTDDMEHAGKSPYRFTIPVSRVKADQKSRDLLVMKSAASGESILLVKKILFTPVATVVEYDYTHPDDHSKHLQGNHKAKLIHESGKTLTIGGLSSHLEKDKEQYTNCCRADFSAIDKTTGKWTLEIDPARGEKISVSFTID